MNDTIKQQLCVEDFYLMLQNACVQSGGGNAEKLKKMTLDEVINMLAPNGIRMVYMPEKHMNSINITWGTEKAITDGNPPKKKQLLCDQFDKGDEES
jgi:hypothetical protein